MGLWKTLVKGPRGSKKPFKTFPNYTVGDYENLIGAIKEGVLKATRKDMGTNISPKGIKVCDSSKIF